MFNTLIIACYQFSIKDNYKFIVEIYPPPPQRRRDEKRDKV